MATPSSHASAAAPALEVVHGVVQGWMGMCLCGDSFDSHARLIAHIHRVWGTYTCSDCGRVFGRDSELQRHVRSVHLHDRPHACGRCGRQFPRAYNVAQHRCTAHGGHPATTRGGNAGTTQPDAVAPATAVAATDGAAVNGGPQPNSAGGATIVPDTNDYLASRLIRIYQQQYQSGQPPTTNFISLGEIIRRREERREVMSTIAQILTALRELEERDSREEEEIWRSYRNGDYDRTT